LVVLQTQNAKNIPTIQWVGAGMPNRRNA